MSQRETTSPQVLVPFLEGVNQNANDKQGEFATLQSVFPRDIGLQERLFGKVLQGKEAGPIMSIHQFYNAYGYSTGIRQGTGGVIGDPNPPGDTRVKIAIIDYPLGCRPVKTFSNALKLQYLDRRSDYVYIKFKWTKCDGTDADSRTSLIECSIPGVPIFDGTVKQAIVGYFTDGQVLSFTHNTKEIMRWAEDSVPTDPYEAVVINLLSLRQLANGVPFTAKFQFKAYFYSYVNKGNVTMTFAPKEAGKRGTYLLNNAGTDFLFQRTTNYPKKSWKGNITLQTSTPTLTDGQHLCYLYISDNPAQPKKSKIWIDDV